MSLKKIERSEVGVGSLLESGFAFNYDHLTLVPRIVSTLQHRADAHHLRAATDWISYA